MESCSMGMGTVPDDAHAAQVRVTKHAETTTHHRENDMQSQALWRMNFG
jgi:hypothetical protein